MTWQPCAPPYSFYHQFIEEFWDGGPSEGAGAPIHRLCTLARKMGVQSFIVEDGLTRPDIVDEVAHLEELSDPGEGKVRAAIISFLRAPKPDGDDLSAIVSETIIGQAVIITFPSPQGPRSYIFEAIFRLPCKGAENEQLLNNHVPIANPLAIQLGGREHFLPASYYCQQNGVSSICAHCSVRVLARTLTDQKASVRELNKLWGYDPHTRSVRTDQVQEALDAFGLPSFTYDLRQPIRTVSAHSPDNIWGQLALLADSGSPCLLVLSGEGPADHVVPVIGHTFNSDEWHPLGEKLHVNGKDSISSSNLWVDHLVIHDDMLGPYYCLSRSGLFPARPDDPKQLNAKQIIAVVPKGIRMSPILAEDVARQLMPAVLKQVAAQGLGEGVWWRFFQKSLERRLFRTTLLDHDSYVDTLRAMATCAAENEEIDALAGSLPQHLWMCEISLPNLFLANRAKLGELIIDAQKIPDEEQPLDALCAVRLPSLLGWAIDDAGRRGFKFTAWPEQGHVPIHAPRHHENRW